MTQAGRIIEKFVTPGAECEINISDRQRKNVLKANQETDEVIESIFKIYRLDFAHAPVISEPSNF